MSNKRTEVLELPTTQEMEDEAFEEVRIRDWNKIGMMKPRDVNAEIQMYIGEKKTLAQIVAIINEGKSDDEKISAISIYRDISSAVKIWKERTVDNLPMVVANEMNRLELLEDEYWKAWRRSLEPDTSEEEIFFDGVRVPLGGDMRQGQPNTATSVKKVRKKQRTGNPAFLQGIERVIDLRFRLLGIGAKISNVNVNWRKEAEAVGVNPDEVIDLITSRIVERNSVEDDQPQSFL